VDLTLQDKNELLKAAFWCTQDPQTTAEWLASLVDAFDAGGGKRSVACPPFIRRNGNGAATAAPLWEAPPTP
jgi:hypothetical protein